MSLRSDLVESEWYWVSAVLGEEIAVVVRGVSGTGCIMRHKTSRDEGGGCQFCMGGCVLCGSACFTVSSDNTSVVTVVLFMDTGMHCDSTVSACEFGTVMYGVSSGVCLVSLWVTGGGRVILVESERSAGVSRDVSISDVFNDSDVHT